MVCNGAEYRMDVLWRLNRIETQEHIMHPNWLGVPALTLALVLFFTGSRLIAKMPHKLERAMLMAGTFILGVPGFLFPLYYFHLFDNMQWFYEFRSIPYTELAASGAGLFAGVLSGLISHHGRLVRPALMIVLCLGIVTPHLKPVIAPISDAQFNQRWSNGVSLQSTEASCGPASAATIARSLGLHASEKEIARQSYTYSGGTESWYLARALRKRGLNVHFSILPTPVRTLPAPSIAGVRIHDFGHFIPIIKETEHTYILGDPLVGRAEIAKDKILSEYTFTGFFMIVNHTTPAKTDRSGLPRQSGK